MSDCSSAKRSIKLFALALSCFPSLFLSEAPQTGRIMLSAKKKFHFHFVFRRVLETISLAAGLVAAEIRDESVGNTKKKVKSSHAARCSQTS